MKSLFYIFIGFGILCAGAGRAADRTQDVEVFINGERYSCSPSPTSVGAAGYYCRCTPGDNRLFRVAIAGGEAELFDYDDSVKCAEAARYHPACTSNQPHYCACSSSDNKLSRFYFPNGSKVVLEEFDSPEKCAQGLYENPACR